MPSDPNYAREAVELWEEYGLTTEYLEGMTYNRRVALIHAARQWVALLDGDVQVLEGMGAKRVSAWVELMDGRNAVPVSEPGTYLVLPLPTPQEESG